MRVGRGTAHGEGVWGGVLHVGRGTACVWGLYVCGEGDCMHASGEGDCMRVGRETACVWGGRLHACGEEDWGGALGKWTALGGAACGLHMGRGWMWGGEVDCTWGGPACGERRWEGLHMGRGRTYMGREFGLHVGRDCTCTWRGGLYMGRGGELYMGRGTEGDCIEGRDCTEK
jgi:hypothetical protein